MAKYQQKTPHTCAKSPLYLPLLMRTHEPLETSFNLFRGASKWGTSFLGTSTNLLEYTLQRPLHAFQKMKKKSTISD